uniref:Leukocyte receptor cluster member 1 n=1 Tax=Leptobrachium leishanense TaxID=445787 RepID=A0A8C5P8A7_9ANUR
MNILPKKSWHVRNKDNVARVRRDEAQAAEEERVRRKRAELAEQEARTGLLRKRTRLEAGEEEVQELLRLDGDTDHINLFRDVGEGKGTDKGNKEYEEEKRKEKERQEKALGILTYLGQSAAESQTCRPWYHDVPARSKKESDGAAKDKKLKTSLDPIHQMERYLQKKSGEKRRHRRNVERKVPAVTSSIEQLRQERLRREAAERCRTEALLSGTRETSAPAQETDDRKRRYNSQFNPQFVRKLPLLSPPPCSPPSH